MKTRAFAVVAMLLFLAAPVQADWDTSMDHKMHHPQLPDLDNGMNVNATQYKLLADDWKCSQSGWVTDIHIWVSYLYDEFPEPDPIVPPHIDLYIFKDIPPVVDENGIVIDHSRPGELVWARHFRPTEIVVGEIIPHYEPWYCPNLGQVVGFDNKIIQYNFFIEPDNAYLQTQGEIYWLGVQKRVMAPDDNELMGWKSSADHWNDDAVYADFVPDGEPGMDPPGLPTGQILWHELIDPRTGESMDLSFVITGVVPEPATMMLAVLGAGTLLGLRRRRRK